MSRESTRKALNDLRAVIGGANTMLALKKAFRVRAFHQIADDRMEEVEAWARRKLAVQAEGGGKQKINTAAVYARWNKQKAGVKIDTSVKDD